MKKRLLSLVTALFTLLVVLHTVHAQAPTSGIVNDDANVRSGPGTNNPIVGSLDPGDPVQIIGCNDDCSWYQIGEGRWIAAFLVDTEATPSPTAPPPATATIPTTTTLPAASSITLISWNVESGGALQSAVADRIGRFTNVDIWGLSEVNAIDAEAFEFGAEEGEGANYESHLGTTGAADRLLLIWDEDRFDHVNSGQLSEIGLGGRAPLWVHLEETATGLEFMVMVNHLHRSNNATRHRQAEMLNAWAAGQPLPVIALGDYNFDWNLPNGDTDHDLGYDNMTKDGVWEWIRPAELVTTQCSGWPCGFNSVLDFFFVSGPAQQWNITSEIIVVEGDFPDDLTTPDHRPVIAVINPAGALPPSNEVILVPTATPAATTGAAPVATATPTTVCPQANTNANLRAGPGTGYAVVGSATQGQCLTIIGRTQVGDWFQLDNGNWIAAFLVINPGPMAAIPVVSAPTATPVPTTATPNNCDPSYPSLCILPGTADLDCDEVNATSFPVLQPDPHGFDGDFDGVGCELGGDASAPPAALAQPTATPVPLTPMPQAPAQNCDASYPGVCIPPFPPDLDCGQISERRFQVVGSDPHGFDGDGDGIGCES